VSRLEHDLLGDREVPDDAYFGVHTLRAIENFPVTGIQLTAHPDLVTALACVKHAAAQTNCELRPLDRQRADLIIAACQEIRDGALHDQFVVDVIQGGAGSSTNMNANEVIANRALELLGHPKGSYQHLHPLDHVNLGQSTNDVYPTAIKVGLHAALARLRAAIDLLARAFDDKAAAFASVVKIGAPSCRTRFR
jgi:aspartate ammonia-lyase